ncbi:hypothetical protein OCU04_001304 [Sclerotinia nivalis]|uniref:Uncharacterized protein n=1 Tax=Sclerotinia nivalis TaxID=352851 RepID=A0A9X0AXV4_9HELO|nr:hypothetical protein OCU04_001304 [Sclerotinia nivalis]
MANHPIYQSIGRDLQYMVVAEARSFRGKVTNQEFLEVAQYLSDMVQNNEYHRALGTPDFTVYIIDFKIWEHFFAMNTAVNWVPFTCVDPRGPLNMVDLSPLPVAQYTPRPPTQISLAPAQKTLINNAMGAATQAQATSTNSQLPAYHHGLSIVEMEQLARREVNERLRRGVKASSGHSIQPKDRK